MGDTTILMAEGEGRPLGSGLPPVPPVSEGLWILLGERQWAGWEPGGRARGRVGFKQEIGERAACFVGP